MHKREVDALARLGLMTGVPRSSLVDLCLMAPPVRFRRGEVVFLAGQPTDLALLVVEGSLLARIGEGAERRIVGSIGPGEVVGEQALFHDGGQRNATVVAEDDTTALLLSQEFIAQGGNNPALAALERHLLRVLSARVRNTNRLFQQAWLPEDDQPRSAIKGLRKRLLQLLPGQRPGSGEQP